MRDALITTLRESRGRSRGRPRWVWPVVALVALVVAGAAVVPALIEGPLRRTLERNANRQLKGYHLTIGEVGLRPLALAIEFLDVRVIQEAHPKPAVAELPRFRASVQWRAVL